MATLNIWNNFSINVQGAERTGKHGTLTDDPKNPFAVTVEGYYQGEVGIITTGSVQQLWATSADAPVPFDFFHYWCDQISYLQFINSSSNFVVKVGAKQPFVLPGFGSFVTAANTTAITGVNEPTPVNIASIYCGNYSGSTANFAFHVIT